MKVTIPANAVQDVVKQYFWLAWLACGNSFGMGMLQNRPGATIEDVWKNVLTKGDYPGGFGRDNPNRPYGDYVFGRMMKTGLEIEGNTIKIRDDVPSPSYNAWCRVYPTHEALLDAACRAAGVDESMVTKENT